MKTKSTENMEEKVKEIEEKNDDNKNVRSKVTNKRQREEYEEEDMGMYYDPDAEKMLSGIDFSGTSVEEEEEVLKAKRRLLEIYNIRIEERMEMIKSLKNIEVPISMTEDDDCGKHKDFKYSEIKSKLRVFQKYSNKTEIEDLAEQLYYIKAIKRRLKEMYEYRLNGYSTFAEVKAHKYQTDHEMIEKDHVFALGYPYKSLEKVIMSMRKNRGYNIDFSIFPDSKYLFKQELEFCEQEVLLPNFYLGLKEKLCRESRIRNGHFTKMDAKLCVRMDPNKTAKVFDFLEHYKFLNSCNVSKSKDEN